tara:strand:+ start:131 stop:448 length:318 start_codon:yes stop_codon:yes gene_type:complete
MSEIERIQKDLNEKYTSKRLNNSKGQHIQMLNDIKYLLNKVMSDIIKEAFENIDREADKRLDEKLKNGSESFGLYDVSDSVCSNCDGYGYTLDENGRRKEHCDKC